MDYISDYKDSDLLINNYDFYCNCIFSSRK